MPFHSLESCLGCLYIHSVSCLGCHYNRNIAERVPQSAPMSSFTGGGGGGGVSTYTWGKEYTWGERIYLPSSAHCRRRF